MIVARILEDSSAQIAVALTAILFLTGNRFRKGYGKSENEQKVEKHKQSLHQALWRYKLNSEAPFLTRLRFCATGVMMVLWLHVFGTNALGLPRVVNDQVCLIALALWFVAYAYIEYEKGTNRKKRRERIPVTVITGFLGSGKTTMIQHILKEAGDRKILVVENEVGDVGIDHELLVQDSNEEIILLRNGCVCCTVRADLGRVLTDQLKRAGEPFHAVIVETTGMAKPAPIIQSFFADPKVEELCRLDAVITLVDAKNVWNHISLKRDKPASKSANKSAKGGDGPTTMTTTGEVQQRSEGREEVVEQIAYADRIIINKADLSTEDQLVELGRVILSLNPRADVLKSEYGRLPLDQLTNLRAFDLQRQVIPPSLSVDDTSGNRAKRQREQTFDLLNVQRGKWAKFTPEGKLKLAADVHKSMVETLTVVEEGDVDIIQFNQWIAQLLSQHGGNVYRLKGFISAVNEKHKLVLQGIHMMFTGEKGDLWGKDEKRKCTLVFIGKDLPRAEIKIGLMRCLVKK